MSEPRVTITLGRSGQVVKKGGNVLGGSGSSRGSKRQRGASGQWRSGVNGVKGSGVAPNDLRLKLMHKRLSRETKSVHEEGRNRDLHEKLSKTVSLPKNTGMLQSRPESNRGSQLRQIPLDKTADDMHLWDSSAKSYTSWTMDRSRGRSLDRSLRNSWELSPPRSSNEMRHNSWGFSPPRSSDDRQIYSWRLSPPRCSDGMQQYSWGLTPLRNCDNMQQKVSTVRVTEAPIPRSFSSNAVVDTSRQTNFAPVAMKPRPVAQVAPTSGLIQRSLFVSQQPSTVVGLLHSLGLEKYAINFQVEEVDMADLRQMGDKDFKDLGIPMGPRKKILRALMPPPKQQLP